MRPLTYRITTLGCRVNHAETRDLEAILATRGLTASGDAPAHLEVVHSCSVTGAAAAKSRQAVRRAARRLPDAAAHDAPLPRVMVTGCYAGTDRVEAERLAGGSSFVVPHDDDDGSHMIERFADAVDTWLGHATVDRDPPATPDASAPADAPAIASLPVVPATPQGSRHTRAELRIQDGCDAHCTFCIIPTIRPRLRSKTITDAVAEARRLVDLGHREIVLTGIFIGAYGHETALRRRQRKPGAEPLADLLDAVAQVPGLERLRISSMEPGDVTGALLDAMVANASVVVPHLHLPLQSGSDAILRRMNRQYGVRDYLEMITRVEETLTRPATGDGPPLPPAITTDIICGFPGETDADFDATMAVADSVGFLHMHVFPFSPRAGTAAARWTTQFVPARTVRSRVRRLIDLEEDPRDGLALRYRRRLVDRVVRVVVERAASGEAGWSTGRCDHYALVHLPGVIPRGRIVATRITSVDATRTIGRPEPAPIPLPVL
ncbi:MAG: MiaB/RimO family radical SAM methylthiotransferase [Phycisphaerales bacterium]|nr:MiaB/RimO family radical SAM methylthiotransferase [Phycisphaerales bacterium]NNM27015.1 MiaB/RimO family radical SAM methylthiotransferase [Phycisphaerales bacterium]